MGKMDGNVLDMCPCCGGEDAELLGFLPHKLFLEKLDRLCAHHLNVADWHLRNGIKNKMCEVRYVA